MEDPGLITDYRHKLDDLKAEYRLLTKQLGEEQARLGGLKTDAGEWDKARALIQEAALRTQETLKVRLSAIVTTALRAVFQEKDISFRVTFDSKRGKTECTLEVGEGDLFNNPLDAHGGGVVDVVSLALRASFWSIDQTRPVLILDEPMKFLSPDLRPLAADMIRMISARLGLQIVMVSHLQEFIDGADRVFVVQNWNGISTVA